MKPDRHPKIAGSTEKEAEKETRGTSLKGTNPILTWIAVMEQAEKSREQNRGRPKGYARGQREKRITSKEVLLEKSDKKKGYAPQNCVFEQLEAMQPDGPEAENAGQPHTN
jgi:hypothetical protein